MPAGVPGELLTQVVRHPRVARALNRAAALHRQVEELFRDGLLAGCPGNLRPVFPHLDLPPAQYWQRSFFSILFLSVFESLGIPRQRIEDYGCVLHAVRGVVTATDNILDHEAKGAVLLAGMPGDVLPNVMLILMQDRLLHEALMRLAPDEKTRAAAWRALAEALGAIADEESREESDVERVLQPGELVRHIHGYRGGRLLELAFVVPQTLEDERQESIWNARVAVHMIGLGLQALDDVTDLGQDTRERNHNLLRSWVVHFAPDGPQSPQAMEETPPDSLANPEVMFPRATGQVLCLATAMALEGFDMLHSNGYVMSRNAAEDIMGAMFKLRGLQHLWEFCQACGEWDSPPVQDALRMARTDATGRRSPGPSPRRDRE